jgi:hypothetical protein
MILFSDLLENSTMLPEREFRRMPVASVIQRLESAGLTPRIEGANVQVFGFGRDDAPGRPPLPQGQRRRISQIWDEWFRSGGATDVEIGFR